jgi:hypothetical protein
MVDLTEIKNQFGTIADLIISCDNEDKVILLPSVSKKTLLWKRQDYSVKLLLFLNIIYADV